MVIPSLPGCVMMRTRDGSLCFQRLTAVTVVTPLSDASTSTPPLRFITLIVPPVAIVPFHAKELSCEYPPLPQSSCDWACAGAASATMAQAASDEERRRDMIIFLHVNG